MTFVHSTDAAMSNLDYERRTADHYPTEAWVTKALLRTLMCPELNDFVQGSIWEPAAGDGAMSSVIGSVGYKVEATDLFDYGAPEVETGINFFEVDRIPGAIRTIITNPPYGELAERFAKHAVEIMAPVGGSTAMLFRNEWDSSLKRQYLFSRPDYIGKIVLTSRPRWIAGSTGSPRHNYAWMLWGRRSATTPGIWYAGKRS